MAAPFGQSVPWLIGESRVALDVDDRAVFHVDQLAAADRAVRADRDDLLVGIENASLPPTSLLADRLGAHAEVGKLAQRRPAGSPVDGAPESAANQLHSSTAPLYLPTALPAH